MIRSMTAFAANRITNEWGTLNMEMRGVNHRFLELNVRLPEELRSLETTIRDAVTTKLARGKVDVGLRWHKTERSPGVSMSLNAERLDQVRTLVEDASARIPDCGKPALMQYLQWPGVVEESEPDLAPLKDLVGGLVDDVLESFVAFREREGSRLADLIQDRLTQVSQIVRDIQAILPEIRTQQRERLQSRIAEFAENLDQDRLEQEVAVLLQKLDVDEELDRLNGHITEVQHTLGQDKPVGRRLDFLMQELHREANTLGSKSVDARTTQASVDLKVLIEQMREQVQNIE